jgi:hypothetical protein
MRACAHHEYEESQCSLNVVGLVVIPHYFLRQDVKCIGEFKGVKSAKWKIKGSRRGGGGGEKDEEKVGCRCWRGD